MSHRGGRLVDSHVPSPSLLLFLSTLLLLMTFHDGAISDSIRASHIHDPRETARDNKAKQRKKKTI